MIVWRWPGLRLQAGALGLRAASRKSARLPVARPGVAHAWHLFPLRLRLEQLGIDRDQVIEAMKAAGIGCSVHFIPLHRLGHFARRGWSPGDFPVAEAAFPRLLSLPLHTRLDDADVDRVASTLIDLLERHRR